MIDKHVRDQLKFAKEGADNLAKRNNYMWTAWLKGKQGQCTAAFDRDGERWSLGFQWTPAQPLEELAKLIDQMDYCMRVAQKEFGALKTGALMRQSAEMATVQ